MFDDDIERECLRREAVNVAELAGVMAVALRGIETFGGGTPLERAGAVRLAELVRRGAESLVAQIDMPERGTR